MNICVEMNVLVKQNPVKESVSIQITLSVKESVFLESTLGIAMVHASTFGVLAMGSANPLLKNAANFVLTWNTT
jgi:hypothetical protein